MNFFAVQETSTGPYISALPVTVVKQHVARPPPKLAYSTNIGRRPLPHGFKHPTPKVSSYGPYTDKELERFASSCLKCKENLISLPRSGSERVKKSGSTKASDDVRISSLNKRFAALKGRGKVNEMSDLKIMFSMSLSQYLISIFELLLLDLFDETYLSSALPFALRASLWMSCPPLERRAIDCFHNTVSHSSTATHLRQQPFELEPFDVTSAHVFFKTHPDDVLTVFAFSLTSNREASNTQGRKNCWIAALSFTFYYEVYPSFFSSSSSRSPALFAELGSLRGS